MKLIFSIVAAFLFGFLSYSVWFDDSSQLSWEVKAKTMKIEAWEYQLQQCKNKIPARREK